ncbi:hypothetical protein [Xenorhabdus doucetiae]|uniref:Uncharacterized protein n=1 Tax=Xenorhabdus doucetiae TaxID=351671 RepID=A0A068QQE0_9GAMM|nr:hypothetical protein [Xenorhabdus doucetiae]TYP16492.1 hypothetical protein LY16_00347 [Xenorhabdus doucetiae]CDG16851.1 conserved protein of unknown function [Xenorhabdus doucetiae]
MTLYNEKERQAGAMILSQLKMFNEAVVVFENQVDPAFWKGFDKCIDHFLKDNGWVGEAKFEQKESCWLSPKNWETEVDSWKYWFETHFTECEENDYYLAIITNTGIEQAEFGLMFKMNAGYFGGQKKLNAYTNGITQEYRDQLIKMGFDDRGKGNFFLPVTLDANQLAECWQEYGAFPEDNDVFSPLRDALEKLRQSSIIFDAIFSSSNEKNTD